MTDSFTSLFDTINGSFPPCPELSPGSGGEQLSGTTGVGNMQIRSFWSAVIGCWGYCSED